MPTEGATQTATSPWTIAFDGRPPNSEQPTMIAPGSGASGHPAQTAPWASGTAPWASGPAQTAPWASGPAQTAPWASEPAQTAPWAPGRAASEQWGPEPRRRNVLPIVAGVTAVLLVGLAVWQLPSILGGSRPAAAASTKPATVAAAAPVSSTPVLTQAPVPTVPTVGQVPAASGQQFGTYAGLARQAGSTVEARVWAVVVEFTGNRGTITYAESMGATPTCSGTLTQRADGQWVERITSGGCDDGGLWTFGGSTPLRGAYTDPAGGYGVTGEFYYQGE